MITLITLGLLYIYIYVYVYLGILLKRKGGGARVQRVVLAVGERVHRPGRLHVAARRSVCIRAIPGLYQGYKDYQGLPGLTFEWISRVSKIQKEMSGLLEGYQVFRL